MLCTRSACTGPGCSMLRMGTLLRRRYESPAPQLILHQLLRHFSDSGLGQSVPEVDVLWHLVACYAGSQPLQDLAFVDLRSRTRYTHGNSDFSPFRVRHSEDGGFRDSLVREDFLFDLPGIDVRSTRDVHVGRSSGQVDIPFAVPVPDVSRAEPAVAKCLGVCLRILE